jgi:hypothetical protein
VSKSFSDRGGQMADGMRFHDDTLQSKLVAATAALGIEHWLEDGFLCTHDRDGEAVSYLRDAVRCSLFPGWHQWRGGAGKDPSLYDRYREYMVANRIRFVEVEEDGARWFLLSHDDDPYEWGIESFVRP